MRQLEKLQEVFKITRDRCILVPNDAIDIPVPMSRMQKDDENENLLVGEYYSLRDLSNYFGNQYKIFPWVDDAHSLATWTTIREEEMVLLKQMLVEQFLMVDLRDGGNGVELLPSEIDWTNIPANGFAIFSYAVLDELPKVASEVVV